ncbi:BTAD domain-containing putative transcriptional regulator [Streptomyces sp. NPDC002164]|uniref:AfsR/SARP family transcriptional regulator n=1 Tax=Streptomyces sp. NPDC002164 TaxID=3364633 RepID=UPI0036C935AE
MSGDCTISVRALGAFKVTFNGDPVERWQAGKARKLLQFLLLHRDQVVSRDSLYDALWPDASTAANSSSLKVAVHALRKILQQAQRLHSSEHLNSSLRVHTYESGYKLETRNVWTDFNEFESLVDRAYNAQKNHELHRADELYSKASEIYEGEFLPGLTDDWATTQREWLRSRQLVALNFLSERHLKQGDHLGVIDVCRRMLAVDSLHEDSYRMLISVHAELGQLTQVQRWYRLCVKRLRDELQVPPNDKTQRMYEHALRGEQLSW